MFIIKRDTCRNKLAGMLNLDKDLFYNRSVFPMFTPFKLQDN